MPAWIFQNRTRITALLRRLLLSPNDELYDSVSIGCQLPQVTSFICHITLHGSENRAHSVTVPERMLLGLDTTVPEKICSPYGYQERSEFGCGGADKWDTHPNNPFFHVEDNRGVKTCDHGVPKNEWSRSHLLSKRAFL